jgi:N-acetylglucosamine-6-phosphate deacetylase
MAKVTGRDLRTGKSIGVAIENGRIAQIMESADATPLWISPGFIDLQVNGYAGHDLNDEAITPETVFAVAEALLSTGVTTFLPTLITQSQRRLVHALRMIKAARERYSLVAHMVPGVHMEGPYISPADGPRGAHPRESVRMPDFEEVAEWQQASGNLIKLVTLSPHSEDHITLIGQLRSIGIHVSIGHTHCTPAQIRAAAEAGAELSTHLGNGIAATLPRHPNILWEQLAEDRLTATFIADGHHLPPATLRSMLRVKSVERSVLIADTVSLAGMPPGQYRAPVGGDVLLEKDGRLSVVGTPFLAGAALPLRSGISNAVRMAGITWPESIQMATKNPARYADRRGELVSGAEADIVLFDILDSGELEIGSTWLRGSLQFERA